MPKLSPTLKALIAAPHARGAALPAPPLAATDALFSSLRSSARENGVGNAAWLTLSTASLVTLNSPETLVRLYAFAAKGKGEEDKVNAAALMREVGLKCISFSGIPRSINSLGALSTSFPSSVSSALPTAPTRHLTPENVTSITQDASSALWTSIYSTVSPKLLARLSASHPDLPVHILESHYGSLLSNPAGVPNPVGRVLTSIVAVACLRAQGGVGPQVISHVLGLRKSLDEKKEGESEEVEGERWLASDEGSVWVLQMVDHIVTAVANGEPTFAPIKSKL